ncbi:MAG: hypothetical protein ABIK75_07090 [candidate division WOR-3 bacterium]
MEKERLDKIKEKFEEAEIELKDILKRVRTSSDANSIRYLIDWTRDAKNEIDKLREALE